MEIKFSFFWLIAFVVPAVVMGQAVENKSVLSIEQIMQAQKFTGYWVENPYWSENGKSIYFDWNPNADTLSSLHKVNISGGAPVEVGNKELMEMPSRWGSYNKAKTKKVYSNDGDIFLLDIPTGKKIQITNTVARESNPDFSGDESKVLFSQGDNVYSWNISTGAISQLTNFQEGDKPADKKKSEYEQWLENDQLSWIGILKQRKEERELRKSKQDSLKVKRPFEIYIGSQSVSNVIASPDLNYISYRINKRPKGTETEVPDYVTESGFTDNISARSKVGAPQYTYEFWIYDVKKDTAFQVSTDSVEGIYDKPVFLKDYHKGEDPWDPKYKKAREVIVHGPIYSDKGLAVVELKSMDNKDRWIMVLHPSTGKLELLERQHDDAWIGGPGILGWNGAMGTMGWLSDGKMLWFHSEETGYSHLYSMDIQTRQKRQLTKGNFEIISATTTPDKKHFIFSSNKESPHEHHIYRMAVGGGNIEKLTSMKGGHEYALSPDGQKLALLYSTSTRPWELFVMDAKPGSKARQLTQSSTKEFLSYPWQTPDIVHIDAEDGTKVPAKIYHPANPQRNGPAVIFVHGAGYLQNTHTWWPSYFREQMFHNILADNGYTVLDIDYRASEGYGRDWRTAIYRFMGGKDLDDQIDGARFLVEKYQVDPKRIGIYGGSYGGFIAIMAQFTKPGVFKSGAAIRSVTDWAHYNHPYTSNILNTPVEDSIAFYKSSPIYHAEGLQDHLLILHGMVDDNVHFQDVVRLAQRLIELGKDNWEFAVFPVEPHSFVEPSSWTDEYKRIFKLFQETLN